MTITFSDQTRSIIESRMKELGFDEADDLVQMAVQSFNIRPIEYEEMDEETRAAIAEADGQEGVPFEQA
jgi:hypothetical protein